MSHAIASRIVESDIWNVKFPKWAELLRLVEDVVISASLAGLVIIPLLEIVLRKFLQIGISGAPSIVQHLTLIIGMLGAAAAARENRLLTLSNLGTSLKGRTRSVSYGFTGSCTAAIAISLCIAGIQFVSAEKVASKALAYGVPIWLIQTMMPLGFAITAVRVLRHSADTIKGRVATAAIAGLIVLVGVYSPVAANRLVVPALLALLVATTLGIPVFATLGGVALILFWGRDVPIASISIDHYSLVTNPSIPSVPLFTLAGYFLAEGGAPKRLIRVFRALFGRMPGGSAIVTAVACAFFTSFTGASGVTIVAIGALLMPVLLADQYSEKAALGLVTGAGSLGMLFPPCLPLILYAIIAKIPIEDVFLGGIIPGVLMVLVTAWWGIRQGKKNLVTPARFEWIEARRALWEAKWELLLPVVAFVALFSGLATPVEAAALTAFYAFIAEGVLHRDIAYRRDLRRVMAECGLLIGGVLLILGVALGLTNYLVDADVVARTIEWTTQAIHSRWVFLLLLNLFLLIVGCVMDIYSAIMIQVPLLVPIARVFGVSPIHLGIIFIANMELGYLTPPVGLNLLVSSYRFSKPATEVLLAVLPIVIVLHVGVLLITYVPWLTTALPNWLGH